MEYINKSTHHIQGNSIINNLLNASWINDQNCYINADYNNGLCDNRFSYYDDFTSVLLENQNNLCCYCMKIINKDDCTLEHIIPHKIKTHKEFDSYLICDELNNNVIFNKSFDRQNKIIPPQKHPHDIAYYNLVVSCDSNSHCNHHRGNKYIKPLFYDKNITKKIEYDNEGMVYSEEYENELSSVGISTDIDLLLYRKVWKSLADQLDSIDKVTDEYIELVISNLMEYRYFQRLINNFIGKNNKKEILKEYKWFFSYYKRVAI